MTQPRMVANAFFTAKDIEAATMTPEQESAAQQGWCMKCAQPSISEKRRDAGMRWLQCSRCTTVYVLPDGVSASRRQSESGEVPMVGKGGKTE